jgi:hypothetical protein
MPLFAGGTSQWMLHRQLWFWSHLFSISVCVSFGLNAQSNYPSYPTHQRQECRETLGCRFQAVLSSNPDLGTGFSLSRIAFNITHGLLLPQPVDLFCTVTLQAGVTVIISGFSDDIRLLNLPSVLQIFRPLYYGSQYCDFHRAVSQQRCHLNCDPYFCILMLASHTLAFVLQVVDHRFISCRRSVELRSHLHVEPGPEIVTRDNLKIFR